ncbi:MAG: capsule assembly Wzi family protein [Saprospiraceae bacterium]
MLMRIIPISLFFCLFAGFAWNQGSPLPLDNAAYHILDRLEIKTGVFPPFHSTVKPYTRGDATQYAMRIDTSRQFPLSGKDRLDLYYIFKDNNEWLVCPTFPTRIGGFKERIDPETMLTQVEACQENTRYTLSKKPILNTFYQTPANLYEVNDKYFHLRINPLLNFNISNAKDDTQPVFLNQRGVVIRGGIDDRIYFMANLLESQARFPDYVNDYISQNKVLPGFGLLKTYKSNLFDIENGYDFLNGQGMMGFNVSRHVGMQFGYGTNFIGNGYRSLILSNFSNNYLFLKLNWKVWKFHYQNIFAELASQPPSLVGPNDPLPKKYMAMHHLSFNITPNLNVGIFESVIFSRRNNFEFHYLVPIILYRALEQGLNSPDNVLIGLDAKWNLFHRLQLYSQLLMDEFKFDELFLERRGWWANKFGLQLGLKYVDLFGIDHLDLQVEYNSARPYTYTHRTIEGSYTHYFQPLAHPLGANFRETLLRLRYQPTRKLHLEARLISASTGEDADTTNWGTNLLISHETREQEYDNRIGQGIETQLLIAGLDISYQIRHNIFLDVQYFYRRKDSTLDQRDNTTQFAGAGIRMNLGKWRMDF